jgi:hypothetical protein
MGKFECKFEQKKILSVCVEAGTEEEAIKQTRLTDLEDFFDEQENEFNLLEVNEV